MRLLRLAIASLITLGLTLSPVAAGLAQAQVAKCEQMLGAQKDNYDCCGGGAACPPSACAAQCFTTQPALIADVVFVTLPQKKSLIGLAACLHSLTLSPDPPPPRS